MRTRFFAWGAALFLVVGCRSRPDQNGDSTVAGSTSSPGSISPGGGTGGTGAAPGTTPTGAVGDSVRASKKEIGEDSPPVPPPRIPPTTMSEHLAKLRAVLDTASSATLKPLLINHPQLVDSTLNAISKSTPAPNAAWTALADSVKKDLTTLSGLTDGDLVAFMRVHHARLTRLMQMR